MYQHIAEISLYPSKRYEYDNNGNLIYQGFGEPGALETDKKWCILKNFFDTSNNLIATKVVEGTVKYEYKWSERNTYNYI